MLPAADNITTDVVGGPEQGYGVVRRWAYNENISDWEMTYEHNYENTHTDSVRETNGYRVEISPKTPNAKDCFLNVMLMTDAGKPSGVTPELIETDNFYGAKIFDRAVFFGLNSENNTSFTNNGLSGTYKYVVGDMKPGKYNVTDDEGTKTVYVSTDGHVLSFEATGNVSAVYADATYVQPADAEYQTYNPADIRVNNRVISLGDTIESEDELYVNISKFADAFNLKTEDTNGMLKVYSGTKEIASIRYETGKVVTKRGYTNPEGGIILRNNGVYMKLSTTYSLLAGTGVYSENANTFSGKSANLYPDEQIASQIYSYKGKTYVNVHILNSLSADVYCGVYNDGILTSSSKLSEGTIKGLFRGELSETPGQNSEIKIFVWTDDNEPVCKTIVPTAIPASDIKLYVPGNLSTANYSWSKGTKFYENDSFELVKTDSSGPDAVFSDLFDYNNGPKLNSEYIGHFSAYIKDIAASAPKENLEIRIRGRATKSTPATVGSLYKACILPRNVGEEFRLDCIVDYKNLVIYVYKNGNLIKEIDIASMYEDNLENVPLITSFQIYLSGANGYAGGAINIYMPTYICYPYSENFNISDLLNTSSYIIK